MLYRPFRAALPRALRLSRLWCVVFAGVILAQSVGASAQIKSIGDTLSFPGIKLGLQRDGFAVVINAGTTTETITSVKLVPIFAVPSEFQIIQGATTPIPLDPSQTDQILVRFRPQVPGLRTALLQIIAGSDTVVIQLVGNALTIEPDIAVYVPSVDFGTRLPGEIVDTIVTAVALGPDSATVMNFTVANDNAVQCFDAAPEDPNLVLPLVMHKGDSLKFHVRFIPTLPTGAYTGQLIVQGIVTGSPVCQLSGRVEVPDFAVIPGLVDFGTLPQGGTYDTTFYVVNTSHFDDHIQAFSLLVPPFSYVGLPTLPYTLAAGDTLPVTIRFDASKAGQFSASIDVMEHSPPEAQHDRLTLIEAVVRPIVLSSSGIPTIDALCGVDSTYSGTMSIRDTGTFSAIVDAIRADNSNLTIVTAALPDTLQPAATRAVSFRYHATSTLQNDTTIKISFYWKNLLVITDSVTIHVSPITTAVSLRAEAAAEPRSVLVVPRLDPAITVYGLHSLTFDISITPPSIADLDLTQFTSALGSGVTITPTKTGDGSYEITVTSNNGALTTGLDSLLAVAFKFFVTTDSLATITIRTLSPEKEGCLEFATDSVTIASPFVCGDPEMRQFLKMYRSKLTGHVVANPTSGKTIDVEVNSPAAAMLSADILSLSGAILLHVDDVRPIVPGITRRSFDVGSLANGSYLLRLQSVSAEGTPNLITEQFSIIR